MMVAVSACKKKSSELSRPYFSEQFYTYYKNFYIEGVNMSRIHIEGAPYNKYALYLLEVRIIGCNKEQRKRHDDWEGGIEYPFCFGTTDPIKDIVFKTSKNKIISPNPLNLTHKFILMKNKDEDEYKGVCYENEFDCLPSDISNPVRAVSGFHKQRFLRPGSREEDTLNYLITFYKSQRLPDSIIINGSTTTIKSKINNTNDNSVYIIKDL
jgi:hypothetical protein